MRYAVCLSMSRGSACSGLSRSPEKRARGRKWRRRRRNFRVCVCSARAQRARASAPPRVSAVGPTVYICGSRKPRPSSGQLLYSLNHPLKLAARAKSARERSPKTQPKSTHSFLLPNRNAKAHSSFPPPPPHHHHGRRPPVYGFVCLIRCWWVCMYTYGMVPLPAASQ